MSEPDDDPTRNVLDLVEAAVKRLDDLRDMESAHQREISQLRADHAQALRLAETQRIDAIRAVDIGAVNRADEVAARQAMTLAAQVATSAEALRTQVDATSTAASVALAAALEPIRKDVADLRRAQYEAQGGKAQTNDTRLNIGALLGAVAVLLTALGIGVTLILTLNN